MLIRKAQRDDDKNRSRAACAQNDRDNDGNREYADALRERSRNHENGRQDMFSISHNFLPIS